MKFVFLLCAIPFLLLADIHPTSKMENPFTLEGAMTSSETLDKQLAPLLPLEPEFPLFVSQKNRDLWMDGPFVVENEKQKIRNYLDWHTFPWMTIAVLLGIGAIGWVLFLTRDNWLPQKEQKMKPLSLREQMDLAFKQIDKTEFSTKKELQNYYTELESILLKALYHNFAWNKSMTTIEIQRAMEKTKEISAHDKETALLFLTEIDRIKFSDWQPPSTRSKEMFREIRAFIYEKFL